MALCVRLQVAFKKMRWFLHVHVVVALDGEPRNNMSMMGTINESDPFFSRKDLR
jgi:hypothetical protein